MVFKDQLIDILTIISMFVNINSYLAVDGCGIDVMAQYIATIY